MMLFYLIFVAAVSACGAVDTPEKPQLAGIRCAEIPNTIYSCLGNPKFIKSDVSINCDKSISECERMTCIFTKSGWLKNGVVDKPKVVSHYSQYAQEHPQWTAAVEHATSTCLAGDLPPQGAHLNCPAYDIMLCSLTSFIKHAQPSQWSSAAQCQYPRQFAAACPLCPSDCFAPLVPYGSCNACLALPRSP